MTSTNKKLNSLSKKFKEDELVFERIRNKDLICIDCKYRYNDDGLFGNVSRCEIFQQKPNEVLRGGMCIEYEKDETYTG